MSQANPLTLHSEIKNAYLRYSTQRFGCVTQECSPKRRGLFLKIERSFASRSLKR